MDTRAAEMRSVLLHAQARAEAMIETGAYCLGQSLACIAAYNGAGPELYDLLVLISELPKPPKEDPGESGELEGTPKLIEDMIERLDAEARSRNSPRVRKAG